MKVEKAIYKICQSKIWENNFKDLHDLIINGFLNIESVPKQMFAIMNLNITSDLIITKTNNFLKHYDLSIPQNNILEALYFSERPLTQKSISKFVFSSKSNISTIISRMEKKELIKKSNNNLNNRENLITITKKGKRLLKVVLRDISRFHQNMNHLITEEEAEFLNKILIRLNNYFRDIDLYEIINKD